MEFNPDEPVNSNMWIIPFLPDRLPGRVQQRWAGGQLIIEPLVRGLPLIDGTIAHQFFAFGGEAAPDDYVTFRWEKPGERGFDRVKEKYGEPRAVDVEGVEEDSAIQLAEEIRERLATEVLDELQHERETVAQQVEDLAQSRTQELRNELESREASQQNLADNLEAWSAKLKEEQQGFDEENERNESLAAYAYEAQREAEQIWAAIEPYRLAVSIVTENESSDLIEPCPLPKNLGAEWSEMLHSIGLYLPKHIAIGYLLALASALYSGSPILLNGPVGVGKTSLIKHSADLLGGTSKIIPVRPAWLDPSDLLGFFDPLSETFRPSPFLTAIKDAVLQTDRLHLVCLDEMNLARIENYGADLLSSLEYSRSESGNQGLLLYSESIEKDLWEEVAQIKAEEQQLDSQQKQRLRRLQHLLKDYPANFPIPRNLVLLGTLNADETTYDLSPKVIDRSFVITYPPADLTIQGVSETRAIQEIAKEISVSSLINEMEMVRGTMSGWEIVVKWNTQYLSKLGLQLGHRAKREYSLFSAAANCLGLTKEHCLGHFLFAKVLPRISFFKGNTSENVNREELCRQWLKELEDYRDFGPSEILHQLREQLDDDRRRNVRYWG